ncbi:MAG: DNA replication and repair protein RecF [Chloroflexi bacterium]|nr:DNA replication and repair protein RecF [Chloroflexota bacterium]
MRLRSLTLDQFRSYAHCALTLEPGLTLVLGENAQGKTNLLEAIYLLAVMRSPRAVSDGELIAWSAPAPPVARVAGVGTGSEGAVEVEIAIAARLATDGSVLRTKAGAPLVGKRVRRNGIARLAGDVVGAMPAVLFTTLDIAIITGSPGTRRRYLDFTVAQSDRAYARALGRYDKAVAQRNALLKRIVQGQASLEEMGPWDDAVVEEGGTIIAGRARVVAELAAIAPRYQTRLAAGRGERLEIAYAPALARAAFEGESVEDARAALRAALRRLRPRERGAGTTLAGPHRDDVLFTLDGRAAGSYGSRAQQRSLALALRLAEADVLRTRRGEEPILLLDDVFSELDDRRREAVIEATQGAEQLLLTGTDPGHIPAGVSATARWRVAEGQLSPA